MTGSALIWTRAAVLLLALLCPATAKKGGPQTVAVQQWLRLSTRQCEINEGKEFATWQNCARAPDDQFGGCAYNPDSKHLWCCQFGVADCWGGDFNCDQEKPEGIVLNCGNEEKKWCCDGQYEECGRDGEWCRPKGLRNPFSTFVSTFGNDGGTFGTGTSTIFMTAHPLTALTTTYTSTPTTSSTSSSPTSTPADSPSPTAPPATTVTTPPNRRKAKKGPDAGVIAGATIGGILGLLAILGGGFYIGRRRGRKKGGPYSAEHGDFDHSVQEGPRPKSELPGSDPGKHPPPEFAEAYSPYNHGYGAVSQEPPSELPSEGVERRY